MAKQQTLDLDFGGSMKSFSDGLSPKGAIIDGQWYAADYRNDKTIEQRLHNFFDFARERHAIFLRRSMKVPKPWTNDPILGNWKFCNIYRELDTVSQWITQNIIRPYEDHPHLWFMLCAARIINWPDSLQALMETKNAFGIDKFDPKVAYQVLKSRREQKLKTITGAYIVNSVTTDKDPDHIRGDKMAFIAHKTLDHIWIEREAIKGEFKSTMKNAVDTLCRFKGYGKFMAYQITVDLSYSNKWLGKAPDYNTFNSAGPGTTRGLSRVFHNEKLIHMSDEEKTKLLCFQHKASLNEDYWPNTHKDMRKGFAPLSLSNISNTNCEFDKASRLFLGQGKLRSRYDGGQSLAASLF